MTVWVDADSCPGRVREIIVKAAERRGVRTVFVANHTIPLAETAAASMVVVSAEEGAADAFIVAESVVGDLVVTRDIPLAADLVERGVAVLNDRGTVFDVNNVRQRHSERDFRKGLRDAGIVIPERGGYGRKEIHAFSNAFDRVLTRLLSTC